jgi:hypothetical protein
MLLEIASVMCVATALALACDDAADGMEVDTVEDAGPGEDTDTGAPDPQVLSVAILSPSEGAATAEGGALEFVAQASGGIPPYHASWSLDGAAEAAEVMSPGAIAMGIPGEYEAALTVIDAEEQAAIATVSFTVESLFGDMGVWFGNLHSHSAASDGEGDPTAALTWARDEAGLDFYAMTDHSEMLFGSEWGDIGDAVAACDAPGIFAALRGFEWSHPINGHMCIYETDSYNAAYSAIWISYIYDWIDAQDGLAQFNHPGREIGVFNGLSLVEEVRDNLFAIETGNKGDGNNDWEFMPHYVQALDNGWRVAPTNNQDNHSLSVNSHRTAYLGEELSSEGLLEAMRARRLYSTDDPDIRVAFRAGEAWMGDVVPAASQPMILGVKVEDDEPIFGMRILTNGGEVAAAWAPPQGDQAVALWTPQVDAAGGDYFYLEVTSVDVNDGDGPYQVAVTAPIWVE